MNVIEKAVDFIKSCTEKTAIIYDLDGDSIGSAVTIAKTLERLFFYVPQSFIISHDLFAVDKGIFKKIAQKKLENVIIVDIAPDKDPKYILDMAKKINVLIIDHHQVHRDLNEVKNIVHVNPIFFTKIAPSKYCASKLTYDICSKVTKIDDLAWLAGMGIINDYCGEQWKEFLDVIYKKYPVLKVGSEPYSFDSNLGKVNHMVTSGYYHSGTKGIKLAYEACSEVESPLEILEGKTSKARVLKMFFLEVQEEINKTVDNWKEEAELHEDLGLVFLELKTRFAIKSPVSTILSIKNPNYTFIIFRGKGEHINVSLRRQDGKVDCGKLAEFATDGLESAGGGGHAPAAGASIMRKDIEKFKESVLKYLTG